MSWIWTGFLLLSLVCAVRTGSGSLLTSAALEGASGAVTLLLSLAGPICLWSALHHVMASIGLTDGLANFFAPLLRRLFPRAWQDQSTRAAICGNVTCNLLGLGNAATPLGLQAAKNMAQTCNGTADDELCRLVILNTASIQLLPTTVAALRAAYGAHAPFDLLPAVWLSSLCSVAAGLLAARVLSRWL